MNINYTSRFLGYDIYHMTAGIERAFISTYQDMGYIKDGKLMILSPQQLTKSYKPDFLSGSNTAIANSDSLINEAIAWYQEASYLYKEGLYKRLRKEK